MYYKCKVWPSSFENKDIFSKEEKEIMREASRNFIEGIFIAGVNPTGKGKLNRISYYLSPKKGLSIFFTINADKEKAFNYIENYIEQLEELEEKIIFKLLDSKVLINIDNNNNKSLNIPVNMYLNLQGINNKNLRAKDKEFLDLYKDKIVFKNLIKMDGEYFYSHESNVNLLEVQINAIIERLSPEYAILAKTKENIVVKEKKDTVYKSNIKEIDLKVTGKELELKSFLLDEEQIEMVNEISYGHRLILANPGAGKSVILLAKAFKICRSYENERVLMTCFNRNLSEVYEFRKKCSGFIENDKLTISTFHKLVLNMVELFTNKKYSVDTFELALDEIENLLDSGKLDDIKFKAIFIDEVQVFQARWIDICYKLLQKEEDSIFLIAGDINQDLKRVSRNGKAVWQMTTELPSNFRGRVKYIYKNYRNAEEVCKYINKQLSLINLKKNEVGIKKLEDINTQVHGESKILGGKVDVINIERFKFKLRFSEKLKEILRNDKIEPSEIAIILPYRQYKIFNYYPLYWITESLNEEGIPFNVIFSSDRKYENNSEGITISTIDSALGLDFRAVILLGLYPLQYIYTNEKHVKVNSWSELRDFQDEDKEEYFKNLKKIYTACSRAKENLYILSDLDKNTPIAGFIEGK